MFDFDTAPNGNPATDAVPDHHGAMYRMDATGDTRIVWDKRNPEEVDNARATFDRMRGKGYLAYAVDPANAEKGAQLTAFDPGAEKIIFAPAHRGG